MMRIVLVDPVGEVLFSGESVIASGRASEALPETLPTPITAAIAAIAATADSSESAHAVAENDFDEDFESEPCPETMRSAGSGVYRAVDRTARLRNAG